MLQSVLYLTELSLKVKVSYLRKIERESPLLWFEFLASDPIFRIFKIRQKDSNKFLI